MKRNVCKGEYGLISKHEATDDLVEGLKLTCPDGSVGRFHADSKRGAIEEARPWLKRKGFDANVVNKND